MKLGIYSRVSTEEQSQKGLSLDDQVKRGISCSTKFLFDSYEVFQDGGLSGTIPFKDRPGLNDLVNKIYSNEIQGLFITELDRLSRDNIQTQLLKQILIENNIRFFDVSGEIDLSDENQELLTDIKSLLSSFEVKKTSNRIKRVLERNVIDGKVGGGPLLNYGYTKDENKLLIIDKEESLVVKMIYKLCLEGKGTKVISNYLNEKKIPTKRSKSKVGYMKVKGKTKTEFKWRDSVVYRILTNPIYKGERLYKEKTYSSPSIIQKDVFDLVQEILKERKNYKDTTNKYFYLLKGKIHCGHCQSRFYGRKREDLSDNQYICSSQRYKNEYCGTRGINIDYLNDLVLNQLLDLDKEIVKSYEWVESTQQNKRIFINLSNKRKNEKVLEEQIRNLLELGISGTIKGKFFEEKMSTLNKELEDVQTEKSKLTHQLSFLETKDEVIETVNNFCKQIRKQRDENDEISLQNSIRSIVDTIHILWKPKSLKHTIIIEYKIDKLTQFQLIKDLEVDYGKNGWRLTRKFLSKKLKIRKVISEDLGISPVTEIPHIRYE